MHRLVVHVAPCFDSSGLAASRAANATSSPSDVVQTASERLWARSSSPFRMSVRLSAARPSVHRHMAKKLQPQALQDATNDLAAAAQHLRPLIRKKGADSGDVAARFKVIVRAVKTIEAELAAARKSSGSSTVSRFLQLPRGRTTPRC